MLLKKIEKSNLDPNVKTLKRYAQQDGFIDIKQ